jgi:catechol 2,3-dioxygenase
MKQKRLGEIVLRTPNRKDMINFYCDVVGFPEYKDLGPVTFLKVSEDLKGHPQVLALFDAEIPSNGPGEPQFDGHNVNETPVHHIAFSLTKQDFDSEQKRFADLGYEIRTAAYIQMGWRSFYVYDPDGNTIEFVCHDESLGQ